MDIDTIILAVSCFEGFSSAMSTLRNSRVHENMDLMSADVMR